MKNLLILLFLALSLLVSLPAMALPWNDDNKKDLLDDVKDIKKEVIGADGNLKKVSTDLREQLDDLVSRGVILRESVHDFLTWLKEREGPYRAFVYPDGVTSGPRCGFNTVCAQFRIDLSSFFWELGDQRFNFPIIEKGGFGDGSRAVKIVNNTPPIILFGIYEALSRTPDWRDAPANLQSIFDEIGDPDIFSLRLQEEQTGNTASLLATTRAFSDETPTQRFCRRWEKRVDKELDPIRLNRIEYWVFYIRQVVDLIATLTSETVGGTIVGEGSETVVPNPLKAQAKVMTISFDLIQKAAQTLRDNLGVCRAQRREIELQVAQCLQIADFVMPSKRDDVYFLVQTKIENAESESVPVRESRSSLKAAERARDREDWKRAYLKLCDAYRAIGET